MVIRADLELRIQYKKDQIADYEDIVAGHYINECVLPYESSYLIMLEDELAILVSLLEMCDEE